MRRMIGSLALFGLLTTGCSDDTAVLLGDISDHLTHDLLGTILGVSDGEEAPRVVVLGRPLSRVGRRAHGLTAPSAWRAR